MDFTFTEQEQELRQRVRRMAEEKLAPMADEIEESDEVRPPMVSVLAENGVFRLLFPKEYGGAGPVSSVKICIAREEISRVSLVADSTFIMSGIGAYAIARYGTEEQKRKYIPPLAAGEKLGSFGLTEPTGGSDVARMQTTATLEGDSYVLNGSKRFVSSANAASTLVVFAKTAPEAGMRGISAFIVEKGMPGFEVRPMKITYAHDINELFFDQCLVPKENLLGEPGQGGKIALANLTLFRPTLGACAVGSAQAALDAAISYSKRREAFGQSISNFQAIQFKLAEMATLLDAARLLVYRAAWLRDEVVAGRSPNGASDASIIKEASMAKYFAGEALRRIADEAIRIHGGAGIVKGAVTERIFRQSWGAVIGEGTPEMQLMTIARRLLKE